ncbi:hypothetical protein L1987_22707 [Smallanthus sonchifolius]|uniref:Uncharacterized protein n=1 Tax=Smallanthus sonchifolius TaxID=185202 RepID=A0ACB9IG65_9ASTR|nr:hypothetical protein L1987_22707 [Smallanthus sonchifolius]
MKVISEPFLTSVFSLLFCSSLDETPKHCLKVIPNNPLVFPSKLIHRCPPPATAAALPDFRFQRFFTFSSTASNRRNTGFGGEGDRIGSIAVDLKIRTRNDANSCPSFHNFLLAWQKRLYGDMWLDEKWEHKSKSIISKT